MKKSTSNTTTREQNVHNYLLASKCIHSGCHNNDDDGNDDDDDDYDGGVGNNDNDENFNFYHYCRDSKDHKDHVAIQAPEELRYKCFCCVIFLIALAH